MTGFEWRDAKGRPCRLIVEVYNGESAGHVATEADLLAALGQLSPGSDGPTDEELLAIAVAPDDATCRRALYNAGLALGEQKQAAPVAELESLAYLGEHHFPDLTYKARCDELQSELAATKAKLAEVERARAGLLDEVGRAMRVVGSAQVLISSAWLNGYHELRFDAQKWDALEAALNAFRTTTSYPPSDRTEAPRPEAGESEDVLGKFDRIREELEEQGVRIRASEWLEPTEEPKPEPQPSGEDDELPRQELGLCSGCDCPKARCDAIRPPVIKCCPGCNHEGTDQP